MFLDYIRNKILGGYFKSLSGWITIIGSCAFFLFSDFSLWEKVFFVFFMLLTHFMGLVVFKGYKAYKDVKEVLEATVQDKVKVERIITDPLDKKSKHYIIDSLGFKNGQILMLQLKVEHATFPLGMLRVKRSEGSNVHCAELKIREDARDHVNDETRLDQLFVTSVIMSDDLEE